MLFRSILSLLQATEQKSIDDVIKKFTELTLALTNEQKETGSLSERLVLERNAKESLDTQLGIVETRFLELKSCCTEQEETIETMRQQLINERDARTKAEKQLKLVTFNKKLYDKAQKPIKKPKDKSISDLVKESNAKKKVKK